jgi:radical SAM superfamily enzyme YgiQ (UPF0313 family)
MKDVVFIYPYYTYKIRLKNRIEFPPLGMLSIAAIFEKLGYKVNIFAIDDSFNISNLPKAFIYAYSITASVTYPFFLEYIPKIRNNAEIQIAGGSHVSAFPKEVLNELNLNTVFVGESEVSIKRWCLEGCIERGVIFGERNDVNNYPIPARHLLSENRIYLNNRIGGKYNNAISMFSSRGCTYCCQFCAITNRGYISYLSKEKFELELINIKFNYQKCEGIVLLDETFTFNQNHTFDISDLLNKYKLPFECNSRVDKLDRLLMEKLVINNCKEVKIGLESGSEEILKSMKKDIDIKKAKYIFELAKEIGLPIKLYLQHGFPFENVRTTKESIKYLESIKTFVSRVALYRFVPLPNSPIYSKNYINKYSWDKYTIYGNDSRWWGCASEYQEVEYSYELLKKYVSDNFNLA